MKIVNENEYINIQTAITIGKYEAMHRGHMLMIESAVNYAKSQGLASVVLSFTPHPAQVLYGKGYKPLFTDAEKAHILEGMTTEGMIAGSDAAGPDYWIYYPFNSSLAQTSPQNFCRLLKERFSCRALLVGRGFCFGRNREGTVETLYTLGREMGMEIITVPHMSQGDNKISTSQIREFLSKGQVPEANKLLGRPFFVKGIVQKGRQLGRTIGFPTANIHPEDDKFLPLNGVYAGNVIIGGSLMQGVTNIGINPTVSEGETVKYKVETHIFDFDADIYGKEIIVELNAFIRPERVFAGLEELKKQIKKDAKSAALVYKKF